MSGYCELCGEHLTYVNGVACVNIGANTDDPDDTEYIDHDKYCKELAEE